jgi:bacterioferritin-associated ferredoxin
MVVCICHGINEKALRAAVESGATTMSDLQAQTGVATCCGKCADCANCVLNDALGQRFLQAASCHTLRAVDKKL